MTEKHDLVWSRCLDHIKNSVSGAVFKTWFDPIKPISLKKKELTIQVPNQFFYDWLEERFVDLLRESIVKELGKGAKLEYQIVVSNHKEVLNKKSSKSKNQELKNPFVIPGLKSIKFETQLNESYTLDNFIEGDGNKLARSASKAIANNPGGTAFNPLVIYGDVGLGKTHLANAIGNEVVKNFPHLNVLYVTTEKFTNQVINAIQQNSLSDFTNFYQSIDLLIVDDIHTLANRSKTQEIFFNIFNQLHQSSKQLVLTSDRPPKMLEGIEDRLISRFKWGLSADLKAPDFETRMAILNSKTKKENFELPQDVKEFICYNVTSNVRELEGVIISLIAQSTLNKKEINLNLAADVVDNYISGVKREITIENIKKLVAEHFSLPLEKLHEKTRKREIVMARQLSMYLAKNHTKDSLKQIGHNFGGRDHSTVIYSCKTVKDLMDTDMIFRDTVEELERKVQMELKYG